MDNIKNTSENYSKEDGRPVKDLRNKYILKKRYANRCSVCDCENSSKDMYCKFCGSMLSDIEAFRNPSKNKEKVEIFLKNENVKSISITFITSIAILFLFSMGLSVIINGLIDNQGIQLGSLSTMLILNLGKMKITTSSFMSNTYSIIHIGLLPLLLAPIISIALPFRMFLKNKNKTSKDVILNSAFLATLYSLFMLILSIVTTIKLNSYSMLDVPMLFKVEFTHPSIVLNSFLIAFLTSFFVGYNKNIEKPNMYISILKKSINTILKGYIIVFLVMMVITLSDKSYLYEFGMYGYVKDINIGLILSQVSAYMWGFANLASISLGDYSISMFNIIGSDLFNDTKLIFLIAFTISSLILLLAGCKIKRDFRNLNTNPILVFSLTYSLLMGALALFSGIDIIVDISSNNIAGIGMPVISTIISSFMYSYIVTLIGYKLYNFELI